MTSYTLSEQAARQIADVVRAQYFSQIGLQPLQGYATRDRGPWLAKADAFIARNTAGDYSIFHGSTMGSETDVGRTVRATCRLSGMPSGAWAYIWLIDGKMEAFKIPLRLLGKTDAAINKAASGTVSIYGGSTSGSETDTTENVTAYNRFGNVGSGKWVYVFPGENAWELEEAEC